MPIRLQSPLNLLPGLPRGRRPSSLRVGLFPSSNLLFLLVNEVSALVGGGRAGNLMKVERARAGAGALDPALNLAYSLPAASASPEVQELQARVWVQLRKPSWCPSLGQRLGQTGDGSEPVPFAPHSSRHSPWPDPGCRLPQAPIPPGTSDDVADITGLPSWVLLPVGPPSSPPSLEVQSWAYLARSARLSSVPSSQRTLLYSCVP